VSASKGFPVAAGAIGLIAIVLFGVRAKRTEPTAPPVDAPAEPAIALPEPGPPRVERSPVEAELPEEIRRLRASRTEVVRGRLEFRGGGPAPAGAVVSISTGVSAIDYAETIARLGGKAGVSRLWATGGMEGALARVGGFKPCLTARAGEDGSFEIAIPPDLPRFRFQLEADFAVYEGKESWFRLGSPELQALTLLLEPAGKIEGVVRAKGRGRVSGVRVAHAREEFADAAPPWRRGVEVDEQDRFSIPAVLPGRYVVDVLVEGAVVRRSEGFEVRPFEVSRLDLDYSLEPLLAGRVVDVRGAGVPSKLTLWEEKDQASRAAGLMRTQDTEEDGGFLFAGLKPGRYSLHASPSDGRNGNTAAGIEISADAAVEDFRLYIAPGHFIAGRVSHVDGSPAAGVRVKASNDPRIRDGTAISQHVRTTTGEDGSFRIEGLAEGTFALLLEASEVATHEVVGVLADTEGVEVVLPGPTGIAGRVLEASTGEPVRKIAVQLSWIETGSSGSRSQAGGGRAFDSEDGSFEALGLRQGSYEIGVEAEGFVLRERLRIDVEAGKVSRGLQIRLEPEAKIRGFVAEALSGLPVEGASVHAAYEGDARRSVVTLSSESSKETGDFALRGLRAGRLRVRAQKMGFPGGETETMEIRAGETIEGVFVLVPAGGTLEGTALAADGAPVHPAAVEAKPLAPAMSLWPATPLRTRTGADGSFRFERLAPGRYEVSVRHQPRAVAVADSTYSVLRAEAEVLDGATTRVEFDLAAQGCAVSGTVLRGGEGVVGAIVGFRSGEEGKRRSEEARTGEDGSFRLGGIPAGPGWLEVAVESGGWRTTFPVAVEIPPEPLFEIEVTIPDGRIEGRVYRASDGAAVVGAWVHARPSETPAGTRPAVANASTDAEGRFALAGLPPGEYTVAADPRRGRVGRAEPAATLAPLVREGVVLAEGEVVRVQLEAREGISLVVTVMDEEGRPVSGATVSVRTRDSVVSAKASAAGVARLEGGPPEAREVEVESPGFRKEKRPLDPLGTREMAIHLRRTEPDPKRRNSRGR
jgi:protocatechuate 3,4-dioxygenase beta subunit